MMFKLFLTSGSTFHRALIFMLKLGWQSRFRLPMLLVMLFMATNNRLQMVVDVGNMEQHNHL